MASSARCAAEPVGGAAKVYFSGVARTSAMNSFRFVAGRPGYAVTSNGTEPIFEIGVKSRIMS